MKIWSTLTLTVLLLLLHTLQIDEVVPIVHTYVPPLTHTSGLGLSLLGEHSEPPFVLLDILHKHASKSDQQRIEELFQQHRSLLDTGVHLRLQMQEQTLSLVQSLPNSTIQNSWKSRYKQEQSIGELLIWQDLHER